MTQNFLSSLLSHMWPWSEIMALRADKSRMEAEQRSLEAELSEQCSISMKIKDALASTIQREAALERQVATVVDYLVSRGKIGEHHVHTSKPHRHG
ncbi:hypothetical protein LDL36_20290 [Komagataeibacter sp. FNDCR1]|nr:hypothetical protein [Komagataeibacter sp. FNDCR1]